MVILGDDEIGVRGDRAICENIVIGVVADDLEVIMGSHPKECSGGEFHVVHQAGEFLPVFAPAQPGDNFLVFQEYRGGNRQGEPTSYPGVEDGENACAFARAWTRTLVSRQMIMPDAVGSGLPR